MSELARFAPEQLLAHVEWVQRLAATLVASGADAEDVAQETWRLALEHPPRHAGNLRHWLALAARNVPRTWMRREQRRREQEGRSVPPALTPSAAQRLHGARHHRRAAH